MLGGPAQFLGLEREALAGNLADGAFLRGRVALMDVTADGADPFFHMCFLLFWNLNLV